MHYKNYLKTCFLTGLVLFLFNGIQAQSFEDLRIKVIDEHTVEFEFSQDNQQNAEALQNFMTDHLTEGEISELTEQTFTASLGGKLRFRHLLSYLKHLDIDVAEDDLFEIRKQLR